MALKLSLVILAGFTAILFVCTYCPILAYYAHQTRIHENHTIMSKRNPRLTVALSSLSITWIFLLLVVTVIYCFDARIQDQLTSISNFLVISVYLCFMHTLIWRLWLIHFRIVRSLSLLKNDWQQMINPNQGANNWYLSKETSQRWGNPAFIKKFMLILMISNVFIYAIIYFISSHWMAFILRLILVFAPWIGIYKIYKKMPVFHDDIGIHEEIKHVMIGYSSIGVLFLILMVVISIHVSSNSAYPAAVIDILFALSMHLIGLITFITSMMMTCYPLKKYLTLHKDHTQSVLHLELEEIMGSMDAIDLLMTSLQKEYSHENLLFIIEITLYQRAIAQHLERSQYHPQYRAKGIDLMQMSQHLLQVPATCPKSSIVEGDYEDTLEECGRLSTARILSFSQREQLRFKHIAYLLYQKYIMLQSDLAVNISGIQRNALINLMVFYDAWMKNKTFDDIEKLFYLYEEAKEEIKALINGDSISRLRIRNDDEYKKIESIFTSVMQRSSVIVEKQIGRSKMNKKLHHVPSNSQTLFD